MALSLCEAIRLGEETGFASLLITDPIVPVDEFIDLFRPGDIYCHMFHETGEGILDESETYEAVSAMRVNAVFYSTQHGNQ